MISKAMVGEAMCLYDGIQLCSVCGEEVQEPIPGGTPVANLCALDSSPPQATLKDRPVR